MKRIPEHVIVMSIHSASMMIDARLAGAERDRGASRRLDECACSSLYEWHQNLVDLSPCLAQSVRSLLGLSEFGGLEPLSCSVMLNP